jgi:D-amino-acid oxidase
MAHSNQPAEIIVIGCGVIGLTSAIRLREAGFDAHIIARELPPNTTSDAAAAVWYVYEAYPLDKAIGWAQSTFEALVHIMADAPDAGVSMTTLTEMLPHEVEDPWWRDTVRVFRRLSPAELLPGFADGYTVEVPLIEPHLYLPYLMQRFESLGGRIEQREIQTLADVYGKNRLIINCTGVYARHVAGDEGVYPLRGQVVRVAKLPDIQHGFMEDTDELWPLYILPRSRDIVLGGTLFKDNWDFAVDDAVSREILKRCSAIRPGLLEAEIVSYGVGLRPGRKEIRLEMERVDERCAVIHHYGHGGAGYTLSWGCADDVVRLARGF